MKGIVRLGEVQKVEDIGRGCLTAHGNINLCSGGRNNKEGEVQREESKLSNIFCGKVWGRKRRQEAIFLRRRHTLACDKREEAFERAIEIGDIKKIMGERSEIREV